jgi:hypothetical protein
MAIINDMLKFIYDINLNFVILQHYPLDKVFEKKGGSNEDSKRGDRRDQTVTRP